MKDLGSFVPRLARTVKAALCLTVAMATGCGFHVGKPYNATSVAQLSVGKATTAQARELLGPPFKARPLHFSDAEATKLKLKCPTAAESWSYLYTSSSNACSDTLEFDDAGVLCNMITTPGHGPKCSGEQ